MTDMTGRRCQGDVAPWGGRNTTNDDNECEVAMKVQRASGLRGWMQDRRTWRAKALVTGSAVFVASCLGLGAAGAASYDGLATIGDMPNGGSSIGDVVGEESVLVGPAAESVMPTYGYDPSVNGPCDACRQGSCREHGGILNRCLGEACPRWTGQVDVLMLWRGNIPATPLYVIDDPANPLTVLSANQLLTDMAVGPRGALMLHLDDCEAIEANYFNVGSIGGTREFVAPLPTQYAWDALAGISVGAINDGTVTTNGFIQSFELNWRRKTHPSVTWLAGFRWVEWNESLSITNNFDDGQSPPGIDTLDVATANDLYGAQIGLDLLLLNLYEVILFDGVAKAGVYGNADASATTTVGGDRIPPATYTSSVGQTGFFGEIGINGAVRLTDHIFWRTGYNFFWISGVATATEQFAAVDLAAFPPTGRVSAAGSVFLHGVNTGLEVLW